MKMIKQAFCREMHAFDALWHEIHLTLREIPRIFASREAVVFLILTALTLLFLDPHGFLDYVSLPVAAMVWIYAEAAFALVYFTLLLLTVMLWRGQKCVIYLPIYSGIAFFFATLIIEGSISIISKGAYEFRFQMDLLLFAIVAQLFEFLFVRYVLPDVMAKLKQEDAERESRRAQFKLGDWACAIEEVETIASNQHYLHFQMLSGETQIVRARISDAIDQAAPEHGIQPHRSWWVSAEAKPSFLTEGRQKSLLTASGKRVPVARGRIEAVEEWLQSSGPSTNERGYKDE
ncbi:LytTR family transcriptional regulator DNA-binding domain-containing protein [Donghicola tyrosinivorans]|uniref:LytTr DNA-binding domain-containing protein n=1 Tax=Donghicola tyrosinivorans TaxID=1652492 RepID=A0A2T0X578_9RHOB|nr:LytTR family transcriptional regulator DNA-binding domain-containing protein [Donghicola tyrosinivorans]PRY94091.1 LytTr DNA-binding domain-containing protein [Donghicola tyrosinivorans]